jgi:hypothetical protein
MKNITRIFICTSLLSFSSCDELVNGLSNDEIVLGLKEALDVGLGNSVTTASETDGYLQNEIVKILLPPEVKALQDEIETGSVTIINGVLEIPYSTIMAAYVAANPNIETDLFTELTVAMNRGAEAAADKAKPIFADAIINMSFSDALGILQGTETSATDYFYTDTNEALYGAFQPDVKNALDQTKATVIYESAVGFLNYQYKVNYLLSSYTVKVSDYINLGLPATIDGYATEKAIDGLFYYIGEEEKKIRADPFAWGNSLIEKVFSSPEAQAGR